MTNILEICQECADMQASQRPEDLFDPDSQNDAIFLSVVKNALDSLLRYGDWQELTKEGCLRTISGKNSYYIKNYVPDFFCLLNNTIFVKDQNEKVIGSITPEQWMRDKYFGVTDTDIKFVIQNGMFRFLNPPAGGLKIVFAYRSNTIAYDGKSFEEKSTLTANTDIPVFDEYLVKLGINWRWLKRNGMDYTEEYNEYDREVKKRFGAGLATNDIDLAQSELSPAEMGVVINPARGS